MLGCLQRLLVKAAAEPGAVVGGKLSVQKLESIFGATLQAKDALLSKLTTKANVAKVQTNLGATSGGWPSPVYGLLGPAWYLAGRGCWDPLGG